jgi:hypothetical protein
MNSVSVAAAAQTVLERVATNVGGELCSMLDMVAQELAECVRGAHFEGGATVLRTPDGASFTLMTVHRADFAAYLAKLDQMDAGAWDADKASARSYPEKRSKIGV